MNIILEYNGNTVESFELSSNPFSVGEKLELIVTNSDKSMWNINDIPNTEDVFKDNHGTLIKILDDN